MRITAALFVLVLALPGAGCSKADRAAPPEPAGQPPAPAPARETKPPPEPLTYARVKAAVAPHAGKQVAWRGKLVRRLERDDGARHTKYYLLLAEDPGKKGTFPPSQPFLVDAGKATAGAGVRAAYLAKKGGAIIYGPGNLRWAAVPCDEVVVAVAGTVGDELDFDTDLTDLPKSAPVLAPATLELAAGK